uniref:Uncharacterized protein n=1 Tax=Anopheles dirus TaxID=7168 RepID=A0A182N1R9_9DIPT
MDDASENSTKKRPRASEKEQTESTGKKTTATIKASAQQIKCLYNALQKYGAQNPDEIKKAVKHLLPSPGLEQYVNEFAVSSEEQVLEDMQNSPEFVQCASWCEVLDSVGFRETCNNELPLAMRIIAFTEQFPKPENASGVDFQLLYLNLANMMLGQPIHKMNASTQMVLKRVYEETVLQTSQTDQKQEIAILHEKLKAMRNPVQSSEHTEVMTDLRLFFADPNINPFRLPTDQLCSNRP